MQFLVKEEGVRNSVYNDATGRTITSYTDPGLKINGGTGYPTIGLGLALLTPELRAKYARYLGGREKLTGAALQASIREAIEPRERQLNALLRRAIPQSAFDALFSWLYNRGSGNKRLRAAIEKVNAGDMPGAAALIRAAGAAETVPHIVARRAREAAMFLSQGDSGLARGTRWGAVALVVGSALVGAALLWRARKAKPLAPLPAP